MKEVLFIVTLPEIYDPKYVAPRMLTLPTEHKMQSPPSSGLPKPALDERQKQSNTRLAPERSVGIDDDRGRLTKNKRVILVIEDDLSFARILYDMAHELDFQCLIAATADEALIIAKQICTSCHCSWILAFLIIQD